MRELAERLVAAETLSAHAPDLQIKEALVVLDRLRTTLTRFTGTDGFAALMKRSVSMAKAEFPFLEGVSVNNSGSLEGVDEMCVRAGGNAPGSIIGLTAQLLALLATFIGEPLMLRLISEAWHDESLGNLQH